MPGHGRRTHATSGVAKGTDMNRHRWTAVIVSGVAAATVFGSPALGSPALGSPVPATAPAAAPAPVAAAAPAPAPAAYDPHTVIVKYAESATASRRTAIAASTPGLREKVGEVKATGAQVMRVDGDPKATAARLARLPGVEYAEPNMIMSASSVPNDPRFGELYGLSNVGQAGGKGDADMDAPEGWDSAGLGGFPATGGVKVGLVDTGIDSVHEDLSGKVVNCAATKPGFLGLPIGGDDNPLESRGCTDDNDHGSFMAGMVAAHANNGKGIVGVSFHSQLAVCKALHGSSASGTTTGVTNCLTYLVGKGTRVVLMALGGGASTTLQTAVQNAVNQGVLIVAPAGNDGNATLTYPAAYPNVISVAATDRFDKHAAFSNMNADVELATAGVDIVSVKRGGGYVSFSGTSIASGYVAGAAAVVMGRLRLNAAQTRAKLNQTADDLGAAGRDTQFGFGRVNLNRALTE